MAAETPELKITYVEHLSIISYLTKSIEDTLINRFSLLKFPLLLVDLPLFFAVLIVNVERTIYTSTIDFLIAHITVDLRPLVRRFRDFIPDAYVEKLLGKDDEDDEVSEETWAGTIFQYLRNTLRLLWSLFVFALFIPIWPIIFLYNIFVEVAIVGFLYYLLIFYQFNGWLGGLAYALVFGTVTFLVSSISVPFLLRIFVYLKYLFSLEKKSWHAINNEAKSAFLDVYLRIQTDQAKLLAKIEPRYQREHKADGGVYYLFLKIIHGIKDYLFGPKRGVAELLEQRLRSIHTEISAEKKDYEAALGRIQPAEALKTSIALLLTFFLSGWIALSGAHGHNFLASIFLSFLDPRFAAKAWWDYQSSGMGYYEFLSHSHTWIPGFVRLLFSGFDYFWGYFFRAYYYILPTYSAFIVSYYTFFGKWFAKLF